MKLFLSTLTALILVFANAGASAADKPGYRIEIKIKNFNQPLCYLAYHLGDKQYMKDTTEVKNGVIVFSGEKPLPGGIYLVVLPPKNRYFEIVLADDQEFSLQTDTTDFVAAMKVSGSVENEVFYGNLRLIAEKGKRLEDIQKQLPSIEKGSEQEKTLKAEQSRLFEEIKQSREDIMANNGDLFYSKVLRAMKEPVVPDAPPGAHEHFSFYYYRAHFFDGIDFSDDRLLRTPIMHNKIIQYIDQLTVQDPDSLAPGALLLINKSRANREVFQYVSITLLNKFAASKLMCMDKVYVAIVDAVYVSGDAWWSDAEQTKKIVDRANSLRWTLCGNKAPNVQIKDANNKPVALQSPKTEYTILYFWSYNCGHCQKVTPKLAEMYKRFDPAKVSLITISTEGTFEDWQTKLDFYKLKDSGAINLADPKRETGFDYYYDITSTPRIFILDKDKRILAKHIGIDQAEDLLKRYLGIIPKDAPMPVYEEENH